MVQYNRKYYSLASDGTIELIHPSLLFVFPSSHSSLPTLLPENQIAFFGFPKRQPKLFM